MKKIVGSSGNGDEQDFEKLKIAICETDNEGIKKVKWFLKWIINIYEYNKFILIKFKMIGASGKKLRTEETKSMKTHT